MPTAQFYGPQVPGVTQAPAFSRRLPDILEALKKEGDEKARCLRAVGEAWFQAHRWYYQEALTCEAMDQGAHWGYPDEKTGLWIGNTLDVDEDKVRITVNVTKAVNDTAAAMLTQEWPIFKACAAQPGVAAAAAAETAKAFTEHFWSQHGLDDYYRLVGRSAFSTGTSFILLEWDKTKGRRQLKGYDTATPAPMPMAPMPPMEMPAGVGEDGSLLPPSPEEPLGMAEALAGGAPEVSEAPEEMPPPMPVFEPEGDLRYRHLMRDQVAFDPSSRAPGGNDGAGIVVKWREPRTRLLETFPEAFGDLPDGEQRDAQATGMEERVFRSSSVSGGGTSDRVSDEDTLEVMVFYLRARQDRPRGDCIMICGDKVLWEGENDIYPTEKEVQNGELWPEENWPVFPFLADQRENCPWGRARTVDAIPIQHAINACYSKAIQHIGLMANVQWVLPAGLDDAPTDEPGKVWRVAQRFWTMTAGNPVRTTQVPPMPQEYMATAMSLIEKLEYITGINAASLGNTPTSQASGRLTENLQQRDATRIAPIKRSHDMQWGKVQSYALRLVRRNADGVRQLKVVGPDQTVAIKFFQVADLSAGTMVYVVNDTSLPRDPQRRQLMLSNVVKDMAQMTEEQFREAYLELLRMPEVTDFLQRRSPHKAKAIENCRLLLLGEGDGTQLDQNALMMMGLQPPPPNTPVPAPWDNPLIHKAELEVFATSRKYLDQIKAEKQDPANQGQSPLEQRTVWLWSYFAARSMPQQPQAAPQPGQPMQPSTGGAPPTAPTAERPNVGLRAA